MEINTAAATDLTGATAVITGGAGFIGSHLTHRLHRAGASVIVMDNLSTGRASNLDDLFGEERFRFMLHDVTEFLHVPGGVDFVLHFASPASPTDYLAMPIQTLKVGGLGTHKALGLARNKSARFMLASTSEVYGDPEIHPQPESYWGRVNPVGPRGVYDEAKRYAESLTYAYNRIHGVDVRVARIFNTYGPSMRLEDGRAVPNFITQALRGEPLTVHGDGTQTRSWCYVSDMIDGLVALLVSEYQEGPVNLGSSEECSVLELARIILDLTGSQSRIEHQRSVEDDPTVRRPELALAREVLGFHPEVSLEDGLRRTINWVTQRLG